MKPSDYPPQEPLSSVGQAYQAKVTAAHPDLPCFELAYGDDPYQGLLLFPSAKPNGTVLMAVHGGGWTSGYKEWMAFMAPAMVDAGITFISAGYRLAPAHRFPTGFDDCCAALAQCRSVVADYGGDPARMFLTGHSAGGHYTALMAVRRDWQARFGLDADVVRGCLPLSGVYLFGDGSGLTVRPRVLGPEDAPDAQDIARDASPLRHLIGLLPPFLLTCGTKDFPHLIVQAGTMHDALTAAGADSTLLKLEGHDHFSGHLATGDPRGPWAPTAIQWMNTR